MCQKCEEQIKAALDHVVVAVLKLARLTGHEYSISGVFGLVFSLMPRIEGTSTSVGDVAAIVRPSSTAQELKDQVNAYMTRLAAEALDGHASVEVVNRISEERKPSPDTN